MNAGDAAITAGVAAVGLRAHAVTVRQGDRTVLRDVDFDLADGELVAIVGPNGAGKSTLLAALAGSVAPVEGRILLHGKQIRRMEARERARRRSVLPQQHVFGLGFSVREIVEMGRFAWARTPQAAEGARHVSSAMTRADVQDFADRDVAGLSGGEQARVALARMLAQQAPIWLLDEPTAALDLRHQESVMRLSVEHTQVGGAVAVVLHDLNLAAAYADRVVLLADGAVRATGTPEEVLVPELLSEVYRLPVEVVSRDGVRHIAPDRSRRT